MSGRLLGQPLNDGKLQLQHAQSYDYQKNDAYATGSQSFEGNLGSTRALSSSYEVCASSGGAV